MNKKNRVFLPAFNIKFEFCNPILVKFEQFTAILAAILDLKILNHFRVV